MLPSLLRSFSVGAGLRSGLVRGIVLQQIVQLAKAFRPLSTMAGVTLEERGTPNSDDYRIYYRE